MYCIFDNRATMRREYWQDGTLLWSTSADVLLQGQPCGRDVVYLGADKFDVA